MKRKTFLIDTSVLIHDPAALRQFGKNDVFVPMSVLEELDKLKKGSDDIGKAAREVLRFFDSLRAKGNGDLRAGVRLDTGTHVTVTMDLKPTKSCFVPGTTSAGNAILTTAQALTETHERVVVVSKDLVVRVKAEAMGLLAEDYLSRRVPYEKLYRGIRKVETDSRTIDLFFRDGFIDLGINDFAPNEYCHMTSVDGAEAVGRYNGRTKRIESILGLSTKVWGISPLNIQQQCALDLLMDDDIKLVTLMGQAGTGKTLLALATALKKTFDDATCSRILVSRPIIPMGRDIGFLPGSKEEKLVHWMQPIYDNLEFLCESSGDDTSQDTMTWIMESNKLELEAVTYIRGRSLSRLFIIVDEAQNLNPHEVKTIISRAGKGTKVVLTGDPSQIDNPYLDQDSNGLTYTVNCFKDQKIAGHVFLETTERSELAAKAAEIM